MNTSNYRQGETYDEFMARQKAEASGQPAPKPALKPALNTLGDPSNCLHINDAVAQILGRKK
jgi:beta-phosphoglucomutase-like phosphatase (HAD superfamily)